MRPIGTLTEDEAHQVMDLVHLKVRKFHRDLGLPLTDDKDVEQGIIARVLPTLHRFDPGRSSFPTFLNRVIDSAWMDLLRQRRAAKRGSGRNAVSLQSPAAPGSSSSLADLIDGEQHHKALGRHHRCQQELTELTLDLESELAKLNPCDRQLLKEVAERPVEDVAREQGVCRGTLYRRLNKVLQHFEDSSLRDYFQK